MIDPKRSALMSRIRGRDTTPELALRSSLWRSGLRFRINHRIGRVRADVAFPRQKVAVFVDGCFWHGCPDHYVRPRSSTDFWDEKLLRNFERDSRQTSELVRAGWGVVRVWEHDVATEMQRVVRVVKKALRSRRPASFSRWQLTRVESLSGDGDVERRRMADLAQPARCHVRERKRTTAKW